MSILAEPRRKQRISIDPQNLQWKNDDQKLSRKLMEKMGWSDGDGLGRSKQGNADHVKLKANYTGKGLGADKSNSYDSTWISHHDDFADLLTALNKNKEQKPTTKEEGEERAKRISIELNSKSIRRRIHYQKFTRAKDTTNYSPNDKSAILGLGLKKRSSDSLQDEEKDKHEVEAWIKKPEIDTGASNTTISNLSVGEYFAAKMAAIKAKKETNEHVKNDELLENTEEHNLEDKNSERKMRKKERRRLRELEAAAIVEIEQTNDVRVEPSEEVEENMIKRRKKQSRSHQDEQEENEQEWIETEKYSKKKERKNNSSKNECEEIIVKAEIQPIEATEYYGRTVSYYLKGKISPEALTYGSWHVYLLTVHIRKRCGHCYTGLRNKRISARVIAPKILA
uniref:G-patch domain-containing protein n=1 Tax=Heterorhabditis bacteriophora TaxID=37862 RepID=A0A1I7XHP8_HETBA